MMMMMIEHWYVGLYPRRIILCYAIAEQKTRHRINTQHLQNVVSLPLTWPAITSDAGS